MGEIEKDLEFENGFVLVKVGFITSLRMVWRRADSVLSYAQEYTELYFFYRTEGGFYMTKAKTYTWTTPKGALRGENDD